MKRNEWHESFKIFHRKKQKTKEELEEMRAIGRKRIAEIKEILKKMNERDAI